MLLLKCLINVSCDQLKTTHVPEERAEVAGFDLPRINAIAETIETEKYADMVTATHTLNWHKFYCVCN